MRIVSPGIAVRDGRLLESERERWRELCRFSGHLVSAGWLLTVLGALVLGEAPADLRPWLLAAAGIVCGVAWSDLPDERRGEAATDVIVAVMTLQAVAAAVAFDPAGIASTPFFAIAAGLAGYAARTRAAAATRVALVTGAYVAVALLAPGRAHAAGTIAAVLAPALSVLAALALLARERLDRATRDPLAAVADARRLHTRLAETVAADPERFALLTMDVDRLQDLAAEHGPMDPDGLLREVGRTLVENVRGIDVVARDRQAFSVLAPETDQQGAVLLATRIERALARIEAQERAPVRPAFGIAVYPDDGHTAHELLASAGRELERAKERRRRLPASSAPELVL